MAEKEICVSNLPGETISINESLSLKYSDSINDFGEAWDNENKKGILNSSAYLRATELSGPIGLKSFYILLLEGSTPRGIFLFQVKDFNLKKSLNVHTHSTNFFSKAWAGIKNGFISNIQHHLLIVGNVLLTGQYGINYCESLSIDQKLNYLDLSVEAFANHMNKQHGYKIKSILLKDFEQEEDSNVHLPKYLNFTVDPFMYIDISWNNFDEYLAALKSKYRVRYKRAMKKGSALTFEEMNLEELKKNKSIMFDLYKQISHNVSFNLFDLHENYFVSLKEELGEDIMIKSVKKDGRLIAFYSLIFDESHNEFDAHFLGYEMSSNQSNQTYLNILYNILAESINKNVKRVNLSRTAMEIKSSVGAKGKTLFLVVKNRNTIVNWLLEKFLGSYVPDNTWLPRNPFKEESANN